MCVVCVFFFAQIHSFFHLFTCFCELHSIQQQNTRYTRKKSTLTFFISTSCTQEFYEELLCLIIHSFTYDNQGNKSMVRTHREWQTSIKTNGNDFFVRVSARTCTYNHFVLVFKSRYLPRENNVQNFPFLHFDNFPSTTLFLVLCIIDVNAPLSSFNHC